MIVAVAIRFRGTVWALPKPNRHHDVIRLITEELDVDRVDALGDDQGFLDSDGRYLTRRQARIVAHVHDQLIHQERSGSATKLGELYSEDLW